MTTKLHAKVVEGVYVGELDAASDANFLGEEDITYVVNLSGFDPKDMFEDVDYYSAVIYDQEQLEQEMDRTRNKVKSAAEAIQRARSQKKNVLVVCKNGINCAPTVIGQYLVTYLNMKPEDALDLLRGANETRGLPKPYAMTNQSFRRYILGVREQSNPLW